MTGRALPAMDRDSRPWWEALGRHELQLQRCAACRSWRWPPRAMCNRCGSFEGAWQRASGRGTVASWVVTHHAFLPGFATPYVVVTVRLAEQDDLLLPGGYAGRPDDPRLVVGAAVVVGFEDVADGNGRVALLRWRPPG
jgi:uncharacterized protein